MKTRRRPANYPDLARATRPEVATTRRTWPRQAGPRQASAELSQVEAALSALPAAVAALEAERESLLVTAEQPPREFAEQTPWLRSRRPVAILCMARGGLGVAAGLDSTEPPQAILRGDGFQGPMTTTNRRENTQGRPRPANRFPFPSIRLTGSDRRPGLQPSIRPPRARPGRMPRRSDRRPGLQPSIR